MFELIFLIIFIVSVLAIALILATKIPAIAGLPQNGHHGIKKHKVIVRLEKKIKDTHFHLFEKQMLLHKLLSWTKVATLKIERKVDTLLHGIRTKAQELDKEMKKKK